jgi:nicotinic acid mononucleotide adenylyltransferase
MVPSMSDSSKRDTRRPRRAVFPGSFNPLTVAHLAIAEAVVDRHGATRVDLVVSTVALGKEQVHHPRLEHRVEVVRRAAEARPWLGVRTTAAQLIVEIAEGYDLLVVGADKWAQIHDADFYQSAAARDAAVGRLPDVVVVPRPPHATPEHLALDLDPAFASVSSTAVRGGRREWMAPEAAAFDEESGAWSDPQRYERWLAANA